MAYIIGFVLLFFLLKYLVTSGILFWMIVIVAAAVGYYFYDKRAKRKQLPNDLILLVRELDKHFNLDLEEVNPDSKSMKFEIDSDTDLSKKLLDDIEIYVEDYGLDHGYDFSAEIKGKNFILKYEKSSHQALKNVPNHYKDMPEEIGIVNRKGKPARVIFFDDAEDAYRIQYHYLKGLNNKDSWNKNIDVIKDYLGFNVILTFNEEKQYVEIKQVQKLGLIKELSESPYQDYLREGEIFFGFDIEGPIYTSLAKMTHMLLTGESGSGKSVHFQMINQSILYNLNHFEKVYYCDLKGGLEFNRFNTLNDERIQVVGEHKELVPVVLDIELEMDARMKYMRERGMNNMEDNFVLFIVDEYAEVNGIMNAKGVSRAEAQNVLTTINRIAALGRAMGIRLYFQTQFGGADSIDTTLRGNLQSRILMRTKSRGQQSVVIPSEFLDEINENPAEFGIGRYVYSDAGTGRTVLGQAVFTEPMNDYKNYKASYELGKSNHGVDNIEEQLISYKLAILEDHLSDEDMNEKIKSYYQKLYKNLGGIDNRTKETEALVNETEKEEDSPRAAFKKRMDERRRKSEEATNQLKEDIKV